MPRPGVFHSIEIRAFYALGFLLLAATPASAAVLALSLKGRKSPSASTSTDLPSRSPVAWRPD